jgi:hypothetical protein
LTKDLNGIDGGDGTSLDEELEVIGELQDALKVPPKQTFIRSSTSELALL